MCKTIDNTVFLYYNLVLKNIDYEHTARSAKSFSFIKQLPTPDEVKEQIPVPEKLKKAKAIRDTMIQDIFTGKSDKFLVIVGPCSADNEESVCEYTNRLARLQEKVKERVVLVPRIYTNKPRTTGEGYKGMLHQPDPEAKPDVLAGILAIRRMHPAFSCRNRSDFR